MVKDVKVNKRSFTGIIGTMLVVVLAFFNFYMLGIFFSGYVQSGNTVLMLSASVCLMNIFVYFYIYLEGYYKYMQRNKDKADAWKKLSED